MAKTRIFRIEDCPGEIIAETAASVRDGAVAVFPTDTVYGIGTGAFSREGVDRIYELKRRDRSKPLPLLVSSREMAEKTVRFNDAAARLSALWPGALTMILPPQPGVPAFLGGAAGVGVRMPGHRFLLEWITAMGVPLANTSANESGRPSGKDEAEVLSVFDGRADFIFLGGKASSLESTVISLSGPEPMVLRAGGIPEDVIARHLNISPK